jgi:hypothetical protein
MVYHISDDTCKCLYGCRLSKHDKQNRGLSISQRMVLDTWTKDAGISGKGIEVVPVTQRHQCWSNEGKIRMTHDCKHCSTQHQ